MGIQARIRTLAPLVVLALVAQPGCIGERIKADPDAQEDGQSGNTSCEAPVASVDIVNPAESKVKLAEGDNLLLEATISIECSPVSLQTIWCDSFEGAQSLLCGDSSCQTVEGDPKQRRAKLLLPPGSLTTLGKKSLQHVVFAMAVDATKLPDAEQPCAIKPVASDSVTITVNATIPGPPVLPVEPPASTGCYTTDDPVRVIIAEDEAYKNATYEVVWYESVAYDPDHRVQSGAAQGHGNFVCKGDELAAGSPCVLATNLTSKNKTYYVTARVVSDASGAAVDGSESPNPTAIVVCDSYPVCDNAKLLDDPPGVEGKLTCTATCNDADGDPVYVDAVFTNKNMERGQPALGGRPGPLRGLGAGLRGGLGQPQSGWEPGLRKPGELRAVPALPVRRRPERLQERSVVSV